MSSEVSLDRASPASSQIVAFAEALARLPSARSADEVAATVAAGHGYLLPKRPDKARRAAGRELSGSALVETGVAGLLLSTEPVDEAALVAQLSGYLAGPSLPIWDYAIISADADRLDAPIPVDDEWELVTPDRDQLASLVGLPAAARHVGPLFSFNLDLYGGLAMLRRVSPDAEPHRGFAISFDLRPAHTLWRPLLALSLCQNPIIELWARYHVEPGRRVGVLFDRVYTEPWSPDGEVEIDTVRTGDYKVASTDVPRLERFFKRLAPLLRAAADAPKGASNKAREPCARLRRVAEHFLTSIHRLTFWVSGVDRVTSTWGR